MNHPWYTPAGIATRSLKWIADTIDNWRVQIGIALFYGLIDLYGIRKSCSLLRKSYNEGKKHGKAHHGKMSGMQKRT